MGKPSSLGFSQFRLSLRRGEMDPVYVLVGEETFFHDEGIRLLGGTAFPGGAPSVDRESVRGPEASLAEVLDLASTYPMSGGVRLIVVREADALRYEGAEALRSYLARPNPKSCLVLSDLAFDKRRGLYRALQGAAVFVDCSALDEPRTAAWVKERLRESGFGISNDLADAIAAGLSGEGLGRLEGELSKLMIHIGVPRPVEAGDLSILASVPRVETAFMVAKQVLQGKRGEAIAAARALLRSGEEPVRLLGGMSWYFRNAIKARAASARRIPAREIAPTYGLNPEKVEQFRKEIGETSAETLRQALAWCLRADRELKGAGARDPANAFERLIHAIGRRAGMAP